MDRLCRQIGLVRVLRSMQVGWEKWGETIERASLSPASGCQQAC